MSELEILRSEIEALRLENQSLKKENEEQQKEIKSQKRSIEGKIGFIRTQTRDYEALKRDYEAQNVKIERQLNAILALEKQNRKLEFELEREKTRCQECNCYGEYIQGFILCQDCYNKDKDYYISRR